MKNCKKMFALMCTLALTLSMVLGVTTVHAAGEVTTAEGLKEAIANGGSVTLGDDITASIEIPANTTVTLNLNGHTLNNDGATDTISNRGSLTVTGSGTVQNSSGKGALVNYPGATASLTGGTFTVDKWYTIKNMGSMTISEGTKVTTTSGGASSLIANGWYSASDPGVNDRNESYTAGTFATLNITGGEFDGGMNTVKNDDAGKLTISGGTFTNTTDMIILNWNLAEISGGTFIKNNGAVLANGYFAGGLDQGEFKVTGGTFTAGNSGTDVLFAYGQGSETGGKLSITGGEFAGQVSGEDKYTVEITGGEFTRNPASKVTDDGTVIKLTSGNNEKFYVGEDNIATALENLAAGDVVDVVKGDAELSIQEDGVTVKNSGTGSVTVVVGDTEIAVDNDTPVTIAQVKVYLAAVVDGKLIVLDEESGSTKILLGTVQKGSELTEDDIKGLEEIAEEEFAEISDEYSFKGFFWDQKGTQKLKAGDSIEKESTIYMVVDKKEAVQPADPQKPQDTTKPANPENSVNNGNTVKASVPKTGDVNNSMLFVVTALAAVIVIAAVVVSKRRKSVR